MMRIADILMVHVLGRWPFVMRSKVQFTPIYFKRELLHYYLVKILMKIFLHTKPFYQFLENVKHFLFLKKIYIQNKTELNGLNFRRV